MHPLLEKNLIPTREASELSGYSSDYLSRLARSGKIVGMQVGRNWFVNRDSLFSFMEMQGSRKEELARALARARAYEYRSSLPAAKRQHFLSGVKNSYGIQTHAFLNQAAAIAVAVLVTGGAVYAAEGGVIKTAATYAYAIATESAEGFSVLAQNFVHETEINITHLRVVADDARTRITVAHDFSTSVFFPTEIASVAFDSYESNEKEIFVTPATASVEPAMVRSECCGDTYLKSIRASGAAALSLGTYVRDTVIRAPRMLLALELSFAKHAVDLSQGILSVYAQAAQAGAAAPEPLARATLAALYQIGATTGNVAAHMPKKVASAYDSFVDGIVSASYTSALALVQMEMDFGKALFNTSSETARFALLPFTKTGEFAALAMAIPENAISSAAFSKGTQALADLSLATLGHTASISETLVASVGHSVSNLAAPLARVSDTSSLSALAAAAGRSYSTPERIALFTYTTIHDFFARTAQRVIAFLNPDPNVIVISSPVLHEQAFHATTTSVVTNVTTTKYISPYVTVTGVDKQYVDRSIEDLRELMYRNVEGAVSTRNRSSNSSSNGGSGSVTSVDISGSTTGLTISGGPITSSGTLTLGGVLAISHGGTGTSTAPTYGKVLVGNTAGGYDLLATSSLGISGSGGGTWGSITGTLSSQTDLQNALNAKFALSDWYATTTSALAEGSNLYFTNNRVAAVIAGTTTDALAEGVTNKYFTDGRVQTYLDTLDKGYFFSTTSATNFISSYDKGFFFSTTSTDYWKTQNNFFSTTSAAYFLAQNTGAAFSTTSADYHLSTYDKGFFFSTTSATNFISLYDKGYFFSTTSADVWKTVNNFFSTTSASYFVDASSTIPKTYTPNIFTGSNIFNGGLTIGSLSGTLFATNGAVSATATLAVNNGGTGASSLTGLVSGNGTGAFTATANGTNGQVLAILNGIPTWTATSSINNGVSSIQQTYGSAQTGALT
ncbi:MAG: helix-turn-helix domain-containing protein, partial [Minisyncoccia bacterium]